MTNELNIYLERLSASVISMVEEIRKLGPTGLKWWVNQDEFTVAGDRIQKLIKEVLRGEIVEHAINFGSSGMTVGQFVPHKFIGPPCLLVYSAFCRATEFLSTSRTA